MRPKNPAAKVAVAKAATESRAGLGTNRVGYPIPVSQALIQMTLFLGALTFMYVSARAVGDGEYRYKFLDPLVEDLKLTLLARNRYLGCLDTDRPATRGNSRRVA
jgi:hypothetical protein